MISVTILVKNGESTLSAVLRALEHFEEIVVVDTGSTDRTLEIAAQFLNVRLFQRKFNGFGPAHNDAALLCRNDWILSIDADEVISPNLSKEIFEMQLNQDTVYFLPRHNYFNGKKINWCGWGNETCARLYHRKATCFSTTLVHEGVITKGKAKVTLKNALVHTPYASLSDFLKKMELYSTLFALEHQGKKTSSPWRALYHGMGAFLKSFLLKRGFLGGYEGFLISIYNGHTAFYKYLKLYHLNKSDATRDLIS